MYTDPPSTSLITHTHTHTQSRLCSKSGTDRFHRWYFCTFYITFDYNGKRIPLFVFQSLKPLEMRLIFSETIQNRYLVHYCCSGVISFRCQVFCIYEVKLRSPITLLTIVLFIKWTVDGWSPKCLLLTNNIVFQRNCLIVLYIKYHNFK